MLQVVALLRLVELLSQSSRRPCQVIDLRSWRRQRAPG
jgi:hypothetical protein